MSLFDYAFLLAGPLLVAFGIVYSANRLVAKAGADPVVWAKWTRRLSRVIGVCALLLALWGVTR